MIKELTDATIEKTKAISSSQAESEDAKADHTATLDELEMLAQHTAELHGQCGKRLIRTTYIRNNVYIYIYV